MILFFALPVRTKKYFTGFFRAFRTYGVFTRQIYTVLFRLEILLSNLICDFHSLSLHNQCNKDDMAKTLLSFDVTV